MIAYQDYKDRLVWWFLFVAAGIIGACTLYSQAASREIFLVQIGMNTVVIGCILLVLFLVYRVILKKPLINSAIGLGDLLLFLVLMVGYPPLSFIILLATGLLFALLVSIFMKSQIGQYIPLAGLLSTYLIIVHLVLLGTDINIYQL